MNDVSDKANEGILINQNPIVFYFEAKNLGEVRDFFKVVPPVVDTFVLYANKIAK